MLWGLNRAERLPCFTFANRQTGKQTKTIHCLSPPSKISFYFNKQTNRQINRKTEETIFCLQGVRLYMIFAAQWIVQMCICDNCIFQQCDSQKCIFQVNFSVFLPVCVVRFYFNFFSWRPLSFGHHSTQLTQLKLLNKYFCLRPSLSLFFSFGIKVRTTTACQNICNHLVAVREG